MSQTNHFLKSVGNESWNIEKKKSIGKDVEKLEHLCIFAAIEENRLVIAQKIKQRYHMIQQFYL